MDLLSGSSFDPGAVGEEIDAIRRRGQYRSVRTVTERKGASIKLGGRWLINFSSNDYLGLSDDPRIIRQVQAALSEYGFGSTASPLVCGRTALHDALEAELAAFTGRDRALLFPSGYQANAGLVQALLGGSDGARVCLDRLCHASIIDGVRLSGARFRRYRHADPGSLKAIMQAAGQSKKLVLTESVFSMDGDIAPLKAISDTCQAETALLVVDDAHGFGVLGEQGRGGLEAAGLSQSEVPLMLATFGKALGGQGAFVAGRADLIDLLVQRGRTYIYSTASSVPNVAGALASLEVVREEPERRQLLRQHVEYFRNRVKDLGIDCGQHDSPIQPLIVGDPDTALALSARLEAEGILVPAIRPPTVPQGTSRLRLTISAIHTRAQIDHLLASLESALGGLRGLL